MKRVVTIAALLAVAGCGSTVTLSGVAGGTGGLASSADGLDGLGAIPAPTATASADGATQAPTVPTGSGPTTDAQAPTDGFTPPPAVSGGGLSSPLTIGLAYINNAGSSGALGFSSGQSVNQKAIVEAFVRGINASGGFAGRQLKTVEFEFNGQAANWSSEATTACTKFTQDNHVSVVIDAAFSTVGGFRDCLQKAGVLDLTNQPEDDASSSARASLHFNTMSMTVERAYSAVVRELTATGYVSKSNQLGVIVENCPEDTGPYAHTILPLITSLGLKTPREQQIDCTVGFSSAAPAAAAINGAILAFRNAGVDRVMFVSSQESVILGLFAQPANSQGYRPGYLLSSNSQVQALRSALPNPQRPGLHGVGNSPMEDVDGEALSSTDKQCLALLKRGGLAVGKDADIRLSIFHCGGFLLLQRALQLTHGVSVAQDLAGAIRSLTSFPAPAILGSASSFSSAKHDGPDLVRVFGFVESCNCMRYSGPTHRA